MGLLNSDRLNNSLFVNSYITKKELADLADNHFSTLLQGRPDWPFANLFYGPSIPLSKLGNARKAYADYHDQKEKELLLFDNTSFGSAREGFLMTDTNIYYSEKRPFEKKREGKHPVSNIMTIELGRAFFLGYGIHINGESLIDLTLMSLKEAMVLQDFFVKISRRKLEGLKEDTKKNKEIQDELIKKVCSYMSEGEEILYFAAGIYLNSFAVCTNYRMIFWKGYYRSLFDDSKEGVFDIKYDEIVSINYEEYTGDIQLKPIIKPIRLFLHASGSHSRIESLQPFQAEEIIRIVRNQKKQNPNSDKKSIVLEIKGLKELLDSGVITQDEFDKAKKKLIDDM